MKTNIIKLSKFILDILVPFGPYLRKAEKSKRFENFPYLIFVVLPLTFFMFWLSRLLGEYGGMLYFILLVPLSALLHIKINHIQSRHEQIKTLLWYLIVIIIGFGSLWGFVGHFFMSDSVASSIGWTNGSPFQIELAFYHLGIAVAGILCIWYRDTLWSGVVIIKSIFLYGAAYVHIKEIIINQNYSLSNTGSVLIGDILFPSILIFLLVIYSRGEKSR